MVSLAHVRYSLSYADSANIQIKGDMIIQPRISTYLNSIPESSVAPPLALTTSAPPGDVIFEYVPLHPAHSNPRASRRYLLTLLKQNNLIDPAKLKASLTREVGPSDASAPLNEAGVAMETNARANFGPTWKFINEQNMTVAGYGFLKSTWNLYTPAIYRSMGIPMC
jgi:hypothetical protein